VTKLGTSGKKGRLDGKGGAMLGGNKMQMHQTEFSDIQRFRIEEEGGSPTNMGDCESYDQHREEK